MSLCPVAVYLCGKDTVQGDQHRGENGNGPDCPQELVYPMGPFGDGAETSPDEQRCTNGEDGQEQTQGDIDSGIAQDGFRFGVTFVGFTVVSPRRRVPGESYAAVVVGKWLGAPSPGGSRGSSPRPSGWEPGAPAPSVDGSLDGIEDGRSPREILEGNRLIVVGCRNCPC